MKAIVTVAICTILALAHPATGASAASSDDGGAGAKQRASKVLDDRDLKRSGTWQNTSANTAYKKTLSKSKDKGATLTSKLTTTAGGKVTVQKGPDRGTVDILVGGTLKKTVKTAAKNKGFKSVKFTGSGKVTVKVRKPKDGVYVDSVTLGSVPTSAPAGGEGVIITELLQEPTNLQPQDGEWFELHNTNNMNVSLAGCKVTSEAAASVTLPSVSVAAGDTFVLARNADTGSNGGVVADATFNFPLDSTGSLTLACGGTTRDAISWSGVTEGATRSLDPDYYSAALNDVDSYWCLGSTPYGTGDDFGTPGSLNSQCP